MGESPTKLNYTILIVTLVNKSLGCCHFYPPPPPFIIYVYSYHLNTGQYGCPSNGKVMYVCMYAIVP